MSSYLKAAAGALPGAGRLPFLAGGGGPLPDLELKAADVRPDLSEVPKYARVCGFRVRDELPPTYPHVLAFPLHMRLMTDRRFPYRAVGLVHIENRIAVGRPLRVGEALEIGVRAAEHSREGAFTIVTEVRSDGEPAWREESTMLRRGSSSGRRPEDDGTEFSFVAEWRLPGDLGRRYAGVSGDRNPIHIHPLTARLFGFPRPIAHGMWTKARCLAALEPSLPDSFEVSVEFRKPLLLPGRVTFERAGEHFRVRRGDAVGLVGRVSESR